MNQTNEEKFFIELLLLMKKYDVNIHSEIISEYEDPKEELNSTIVFSFRDKIFVQDYPDEIDIDSVNGFVNVNDDNEHYTFPATQYFNEKGITIQS